VAVAFAACSAQSPSRSSDVAGLEASGVTFEAGDSVNSPLGDYLAGNFALDTGLLAEAATYFEQALVKAPDNPDLRRQLFLLTLAGGTYDAALEQARALAAGDASVAEAELLLTLDDVRSGRLDKGHRRLQGMADQGIAGLTVPFVDAWVLFAQDRGTDKAKARERLDQSESLGPLNSYHKAMMLDLSGHPEQAVPVLSSAMPEAGPAPMRMLQARPALPPVTPC
jgi:tetratricopeptide (TPR) repeat protein